MRKSLSIDWLQLHVDMSGFTMAQHFTWIKSDFQTKQFRQVYTVNFRNEEFCSLVCEPTSSIIPANCGLVKFKNRELYGQNLLGHINDFLDSCNLKYVGMTRIDVACDFNYFFGSLDPHTLINRFMIGKYLKIGQGKYTLIGAQAFNHTYEYLRFGSKTSDINVYLYNKTKEFEQVHDKPYIRKLWEKSGINQKKTVWRLEISLKGTGSNYLDEYTGELKRLHYTRLFEENFLWNYYIAFINHYFRFVVDDGKSRKDRMDPVLLFPSNVTQYRPLYLPTASGAGRAEKIFLKKLHMLDQELRGFNEEAMEGRSIVLAEFIEKTNLQEFYDKKCSSWNRLTFKE